MASRQNRETRKEYPTGHNKGNESPSRAVPRTNGGNDDEVTTFGAPMGVPPVVDDTAEREALLNTRASDEEVATIVADKASDSRDEVRRRAQDEADNRPTEAAEVTDGDGDMTVFRAAKDLREHELDTEEADRPTD